MAQSTRSKVKGSVPVKPLPDPTIASNRQASYNYELLDRFEAGVALLGTEIKSIRDGHANLREAYCRPQKDEMWLLNCHIAEYKAGGYQNHEPTRPRKLLLHKGEILRLRQAVDQKGLTIVPTRMYFKRGRVKVEIAVARGKRAHDKRDATAERDAKREIQRALRHSVR